MGARKAEQVVGKIWEQKLQEMGRLGESERTRTHLVDVSDGIDEEGCLKRPERGEACNCVDRDHHWRRETPAFRLASGTRGPETEGMGRTHDADDEPLEGRPLIAVKVPKD